MAKKDNRGWIKLYRQIQESAIWLDDEPFNRRDAWIDLLLMANHEDRTIIIKGKPIVIHEGQHWTSLGKLSDRWKWSRNKVKRYFALLEELDMAHISGTPNGTLITLVRYGFFQGGRYSQRHTDEPSDGLSDGLSDEPRTRTNKELRRMNKNRAAPVSDSGGFEIEE